ncbi:growth hormone receptor a [Anoplopoma fimbria]|uniref:growth hormone receptor a n=1 Tax=Anoplopoma fimbria TaxID=229290 RepID=UPI0023ECB0F8|nr:growth hormone receptor a [Anoplopoma fimbria]XP_054466150.1 growth hormone receptor a [Anoplopoma fimbria]
MAVLSSSSNLLLLLLMSSLDWLSTPGFALLMGHQRVTSPAPLEPHITECISRDQATFQCWWSQGNYHNLSSPGALRLFYIKKDSPTSEWKECPEYVHSNRMCFFDVTHTSVWIAYCMQLRSQENITYFNEEDCFTVENIVRPDPPVSLNWTLLSISLSGLNYDVMVNWEPPPSADVGAGWMRIEYEIQYRARNTTKWEALEMQPQTQQTIFGLHIGKEYEVHIRCRMQAFTKFGEFSDSIFIHVTEVPNKDSTFPLTLVLAFVGIVGILILIMLIVVSQQHRLMVILLPPVPAPKIKGIDPEMLKKGKLNELNFIPSGGMGGMPTYAADFYQDEPWVEFIEVDAEDADTGEKEENQGSDTQRLLDLPQPVSHHMNIGFSNAVSYPDDDSGRASCYDPDLPDQDTLMLMATLLPGQPEDREASLDVVKKGPAPERGERPLVQTQTGGPQTWVNTDFYAQVSNVMPSGGVVLSPGQQLRIQESTSGAEEETQKKGKEHKGDEDSEEDKVKELQFQLLVVDPEGGSYTTESNARQIGTPPSSTIPGEGYQTIHPQPAETKPAATAEDNQSPYILPDSPQSQLFAPVADYTVVQEVDSQHSLLLNPPPRQSPPPCLPQHPLKALPAMPVGYITPDLLGNLSP